MTRPAVKTPPTGETPLRMADKMRIIDDYLLVEFTPASSSDASAPNIKLAYDSTYLYLQISEGVWKRSHLATW